jgi:phage anti-repressor protein
MEFSHECALALVQSTDPFPVDFDRGWQWIGYKRKDTAKDALTANFEKGVDYAISFSSQNRKTSRGGRPKEIISLTVDAFKAFCMMAGTEKGKEVRRYFIECERIAKQAAEVIPAQATEIKRLELELHLVQAKQRYQDSAQGIIASTSWAMLLYLRGDGPPPVQIQYRERFIDHATGLEIGSSAGRSLTQLIADVGLNPKSTRDRNRVKKILKCCGMDYDSGQAWSTASYLREYLVLEDEAYNQALKAVLCEVLAEGSQPNLFIHQMQQASLADHAGSQPRLTGE